MQTYNLFRNIPLTRTLGWSHFAWSLWTHNTDKAPGKLSHHVKAGTVVMRNVKTCVAHKTVLRMKAGAKGTRKKNGEVKRTVFAWLRGEVVTGGRFVKGRKITLNPEKGEYGFIYSDTRKPCPSHFPFIIADTTGCYAATKA
jgi:hypothetical protein